MKRLTFLILLFMAAFSVSASAQEIPISDYSVDSFGRVQIQVASSSDYYYVLYCRHAPGTDPEWAVSVTLGQDGTTALTEQVAAYSVANYRVMQHRRDDPADTDGDEIDDLEELLNPVRLNPLNPAEEIDFNDGTVSIPDRATFEGLSYQGQDVLIDRHLEDLEYVKFYILDANTDNPKAYFMNTETHRAHMDFARAVGISFGRGGGGGSSGQMRGEIIYHPYVTAPSGLPGVYRFEFEPNDSYPFEDVRMAYELLAATMPVLRNNLAYYPMPNAALPRYWQEKALYDASRVAILLEEDIFAEVSFMALNIAEGYGLLNIMELEERPNSRDIVIYEALPNELSRVGGIITTVPQTPLSHVNLRAIQDNVPNAYIRNALEIDTIANLIGEYIYFRVNADGYEIREATLAEVEAHYADLRPTEPQTPVRNLSVTAITPLDDIAFEQSDSFGVKTANLATLRTFGFPEGTIPDGFGVPFYFYDEFMKFNGFYDQAQTMLADPDFQEDYNVQDEMLSDFRDDIEDGDMPQWMWDALTVPQASFPEGTSIRCRSSTNNEDLPGFSGAGLYDSRTQHPDEGHISKSIKQVFASLWNFRAFDERQFYRIDHFAAAMGVLVHPNFSNEKANGVGVTTDPIYQTENTYYLNTQVGEDLVTNPDSLSIPEEILLSAAANAQVGYTVVRPSNQVPDGQQILSEAYLNELRAYLGIIHSEFRDLYDAGSNDDFAMEIEYKITSEDNLAIKQARPWVFYSKEEPARSDAQIISVTSDLLTNPAPGESFTLTVHAVVPEGSTLAHRFYSRAGYGLDPETWGGNGWVLGQVWGSLNAFQYMFPAAGNYYVIGHVAAEGETWAFGYPQGGFNVMASGQNQIVSVTSDLSGNSEAGETFRFTVNAVSSEGVTLNYRFYYREGYGLDPETWGGNTWTRVKNWSENNWADYTFSNTGNYYVVGHVVESGEDWGFGDLQGGFNVVVK